MKVQIKTKRQDERIYLMKRDNSIIFKGAFPLPKDSQHTVQEAAKWSGDQNQVSSLRDPVPPQGLSVRRCPPGCVRRASPDFTLPHSAL